MEFHLLLSHRPIDILKNKYCECYSTNSEVDSHSRVVLAPLAETLSVEYQTDLMPLLSHDI